MPIQLKPRPDFDLFSANQRSILQPLTPRAFAWLDQNCPLTPRRLCGGIEVTPLDILPILEEIKANNMEVA